MMQSLEGDFSEDTRTLEYHKGLTSTLREGFLPAGVALLPRGLRGFLGCCWLVTSASGCSSNVAAVALQVL